MELNFEEGGGGTASDSSGNNNHGTLEDAQYTTVSAEGSHALLFDGVDDRVVCSGNETLRPHDMSLSLWVKHVADTISPNYGGIIKGAYGSGFTTGFRILDYSNEPLLQISFGDPGPVWISGEPFVQDEWTHLVFTYDHEHVRLYQDGDLVDETQETRDIHWGAGGLDLTIGWAQWFFTGLIDHVSMYAFALSEEDVQNLYNGNPSDCEDDDDCDDGIYCNGAEACVDDACSTGTAVDCNDGVACTVDTCNESADACDNTPDNGICDDGQWCNGAETCDAVSGCQAGTTPCTDDGLFCNGTESCDEESDQCLHTGDPCADGNDCTDDLCIETIDTCRNLCNATGYGDPCCEDDACAAEAACEAPVCNDQDGDGFGSPAEPSCPDTRADCDNDSSDDPAECDTCTCGVSACAGCARCIHPDADEFTGDAYDSNCNGDMDCFIATATFGTEMEGKIHRLRAFRDRYLLEHPVGRTFVDSYYRYSPPIAAYIADHGLLRTMVRVLLLPVVGFVFLLT